MTVSPCSYHLLILCGYGDFVESSTWRVGCEKTIEKLVRATCVMGTKVRHGSRGMQAFVTDGMFPLDNMSHGDASSITCLCWADWNKGRSRMPEDVGFSQPYGAILAKIRHLKHDNEMHDNSSEVPKMLTRAKGFLHGHAMKARLILGCGAVKTKIFWPILDRKSTRLNSSHSGESRMPSSA